MLQSQLFSGDALLEAVAADQDRISTTQHRTDPAVGKIQLALLTWDPNSLSQHGADGEYGSETSDAVRRFKIQVIGVPAGQVIADVGPQTVIRLDELRAVAEASPVCSARITAVHSAMTDLACIDVLSLVRATASEEPDGRWSVVAYAPVDALNTLTQSGYEVVVLRDPDALQRQWDAIQDQVE